MTWKRKTNGRGWWRTIVMDEGNAECTITMTGGGVEIAIRGPIGQSGALLAPTLRVGEIQRVANTLLADYVTRIITGGGR